MTRLIDADELITRIESYIERKAITEKDAKIFELICDLINTAPTVEYPFYQEAYQTGYEEGKNERPHGKWKHIVEEDNDVECPFCGFQEDGIYYNYCPSCGADMRGAENDR